MFWKGGAPGESGMDERTPPLMKLPEEPGAVLRASVWGMSVPWTLAVAAAIGVLMMAVPGMLLVQKPMASIFHLGGSLVVVVSVIAMGEPLRIGRFLNLPLGTILAVGPWVAGGGGLAAQLTGLLAGAAVIALTLPRGPVHESFGGWDRLVR